MFFIHELADGHLDCFYLLALVKSAAMNMHVQVFVGTPVFNSVWSIPRSGVAGSCGNWIAHVLRNCLHASPPLLYLPPLSLIHVRTRVHCDFFSWWFPAASADLCIPQRPLLQLRLKKLDFHLLYLPLHLPISVGFGNAHPSTCTHLQPPRDGDGHVFCAQRRWVLFLPFYCWAIPVTTGGSQNRWDSVAHQAQVFIEVEAS